MILNILYCTVDNSYGRMLDETDAADNLTGKMSRIK